FSNPTSASIPPLGSGCTSTGATCRKKPKSPTLPTPAASRPSTSWWSGWSAADRPSDFPASVSTLDPLPVSPYLTEKGGSPHVQFPLYQVRPDQPRHRLQERGGRQRGARARLLVLRPLDHAGGGASGKFGGALHLRGDHSR